MLKTVEKPARAEFEPALQPNGPAAAMILSGAIGVFVLGLATVLASASPAVKDLLNWWGPAGPLSGKSSVGVIAWLVAWLPLSLAWRRREVAFGRVWVISLILIALGFVMTFPPVFEALEKH